MEAGTVVVTGPVDGREIGELRFEGAVRYTVHADGLLTIGVPGRAPRVLHPDEWGDVEFEAG
jgi:hypothetical protein